MWLSAGLHPIAAWARVVEEGFNHLVFWMRFELWRHAGVRSSLLKHRRNRREISTSLHTQHLAGSAGKMGGKRMGIRRRVVVGCSNQNSLKRAGSLTTRCRTTLDALGELLCSLEDRGQTHCRRRNGIMITPNKRYWLRFLICLGWAVLVLPLSRNKEQRRLVCLFSLPVASAILILLAVG